MPGLYSSSLPELSRKPIPIFTSKINSSLYNPLLNALLIFMMQRKFVLQMLQKRKIFRHISYMEAL